MQYLTGIHALNLVCSLDTPGDWHRSALAWEDLIWQNSEDSLFGDYGIEKCDCVPNYRGICFVANHIRALLDLLVIGNFFMAQGMRDELIDNSKYTLDIFDKVSLLVELRHWDEIDIFMEKEYMMQWINYKLNKR